MSREDRRKALQDEPTVLDWVKSLLKLSPIPIPESEELPDQEQVPASRGIRSSMADTSTVVEAVQEVLEVPAEPTPIQISAKHLRLPVALVLGLLAQFALESRPERLAFAVGMYLIAGLIVGWGAWSGDFKLPLPRSGEGPTRESRVRMNYLGYAALLSALTFLTTRGNRFNILNLFFWVGSLTCLFVAFWEGEFPHQRIWTWIRSKVEARKLSIHIEPWHLILLATISLVVFFRFTQLERVPYEMWSDQAEKLWDVMDVLAGKYSIFFPRNTGREAMQFYMAATTASVLKTGISFETLKIGTILAGLLTLPYLYLFAREFGGRYVGLAAVLLAGVGYWPNVISRLGLRFPLFPLFVAPAMYYLLRGIRLRRRNDIILCGLSTGLGLHGYSPARVIPFAVLVGVLLYYLHQWSRLRRRKALLWLVVIGIFALAVFMPLLGAISNVEYMKLYLGRMVSRVATTEQPYPDHPLKLLIENLWRGLRMFAWDDGEIWVVSIPYRPVLDWVTGAFFHLGIVILFVRFLRKRRWQDLFLLLLVPILMLPSILALAFPGENPAPNRASGAIIPVFTIAAVPLVLLPKWAKEAFKSKVARGIAIVAALLLFLIASVLNYNLVFEEFTKQHRRNTWNTSEIGRVIRGFASTIGSYETAHVIPYPHWVDTRLVGITAGDPDKDYGVWPQDLDKIPPEPDRPQLFVFKPEDAVGLERLRELYPHGILRHGESAVEGRDFMLYYVFPEEDIELDIILPEQ